MTEIPTARLRLRIREKATRRTFLAFWPWDGGIALCIRTGTRRSTYPQAGYTEYNDRGEPVLDSWQEPIVIFPPGL